MGFNVRAFSAYTGEPQGEVNASLNQLVSRLGLNLQAPPGSSGSDGPGARNQSIEDSARARLQKQKAQRDAAPGLAQTIAEVTGGLGRDLLREGGLQSDLPNTISAPSPGGGSGSADYTGIAAPYGRPDSYQPSVIDPSIPRIDDFLAEVGPQGAERNLLPLDLNSPEALLNRYLQDQGEKNQLSSQIEGLDDRIATLYAPFASTGTGDPPQEWRHLVEAYEYGGIESVRALREGFQDRRDRIDALVDERAGLADSLYALFSDGDDPESAAYKYLRDAGVSTSGLSPENPEAWASRIYEASVATAEQSRSSGLDGVIGTNVDGFRALTADGKISLDTGYPEANFEVFDADDYVDYFGLEYRFNPIPVLQAPREAIEQEVQQRRLAETTARINAGADRGDLPGAWTDEQLDQAVEQEIIERIGLQMANQDPALGRLPQAQLDELARAVLDRVTSEPNYSSAGGNNEWIMIQGLFAPQAGG